MKVVLVLLAPEFLPLPSISITNTNSEQEQYVSGKG